MLYFWYFIILIISIVLTRSFEKVLYRFWEKKIKAPFLITLIFFIALWWIFAVIVNINSG